MDIVIKTHINDIQKQKIITTLDLYRHMSSKKSVDTNLTLARFKAYVESNVHHIEVGQLEH